MPCSAGRDPADAADGEDRGDHALEVIERNAASQLRLVEDLLDMARVISGKLRLELEAIPLEDVVARGHRRRRARRRRQEDRDRRRVRRAAAAAINGDSDRLQQAVWNLMSNAVKFTEPGGRVDVADRRVGG